jgi:hypothetical protein
MVQIRLMIRDLNVRWRREGLESFFSVRGVAVLEEGLDTKETSRLHRGKDGMKHTQQEH